MEILNSKTLLAQIVATVVLSVIFTLALVYAIIEIPNVIDSLLHERFIDAPDWERLIDLRPVGYISFLVTWFLILVGLATSRLKLSTLGSIFSFLPTFGYFAAYMFFLAGIGVTRILWVPLLDLSPNVLKLGYAVYLPYLLLELLAAPVPWTAYAFPTWASYPISLIITRIGLLVFSFSTVTWLYGKFRGSKVIDFWIYRYSRHPQYLGFLLWSYGILLQATITYPPGGRYIPPPSLPWLISTLTMIGVAMYEENMMIKKHDETYTRYRSNTSFLLPLPKQLSTLLAAPTKILLKKSWPENGKEISYTIAFYSILLILISIPTILLFPL